MTATTSAICCIGIEEVDHDRSFEFIAGNNGAQHFQCGLVSTVGFFMLMNDFREFTFESLEMEQLSEGLSLIRPAFGYSACPDHSLKKDVFDLLDAPSKIGVSLTTSYAIYPNNLFPSSRVIARFVQ